MSEYTLVERPIIEYLQGMGYEYVRPSEHPTLRARENQVLFEPHLVEALMRINGIDAAEARACFGELAGVTDNERWLALLRGEYSRKIAGEDTHRTIRLIDFDQVENNRFVVTNQLRVRGEHTRIPDVVVYVNGIPLVVLEAKSPINPSQGAWDAVSQVKILEEDVPRLFYSNLFCIATNDVTFLYGATGAPKEYWLRWRDPWPRQAAEFVTPCELGLYAVLEPARLLDLLAHFVVFEVGDDGRRIKKICRYQQFRAVNKIVERVCDADQRRGLVWHTQGSGKSLTMVFAVLKLKFHRGLDSPALQNPNILVVTDRRDLDRQITNTFRACGLPNPVQARSIQDLRTQISSGGVGRTVLSTIHRFYTKLEGDTHTERRDALVALAIPDSDNWIVLVDECHRTQEKDLGAYLRATLPEARFFGFTGTPVRKDDLDTFANFGAPGEWYLDKYGIDDAVRDEATVPIYYMSRMTEWHLEDKELDVVFDQWFAAESDERLEELKRRGVAKGDLARFPARIDLIAKDIWEHYRANLAPDGYKAQVVAIDRPACVLYKQALDRHIARYFEKVEGLPADEAAARAAPMSQVVFSPGPLDRRDHPELVPYHLDEAAEKQVIANFTDAEHPLVFLIVCNKYLTGFDAPIEQAMYLDNPLRDQNLLQAIARTNRRCGDKEHGIVVDYIGVAKSLSDALSAYRREDVADAMRSFDGLHDALRRTHREAMAMVRGATPKEAVHAFEAEDEWFTFRARARAFIKAYAAVSPDPFALPYAADMKFVAAMVPYGRLRFDGVEETDYREYSEKIRAMLAEHLEVTGLKTVCKLRSLHDPDFWKDFEAEGEDLEVAAVRKTGELKKILRERMAENPLMYEKFSQRVLELIRQFRERQLTAAEYLNRTKEELATLTEDDAAWQASGLTRQAYGIRRILETFVPYDEALVVDMETLRTLAEKIDALYASDESAPRLWQEKDQLKKELRQQVRKEVFPVGLRDWKSIPDRVEEYAVRQYAKW